MRTRDRWLVLALLLATTAYALAEELTLTTYYPSPRGVYDQLKTMGQTILAQTGGNVGIGTATPTQKLDVDGQVRIRGGGPAVGRVLMSDANGVASWAQSLHGKKVFPTPGTFTFTVPPGVTKIWVTAAGAGGGGGTAVDSCDEPNSGGLGGSGGYSYLNQLSVTPSTVYTVTIGAGGPGGHCPNENSCYGGCDPQNGSDGGTTALVGLVSYGGGKGGSMSPGGFLSGASGPNGVVSPSGGLPATLNGFGSSGIGGYIGHLSGLDGGPGFMIIEW